MLYIYYVKGRVRTDAEACGSSFIGNWEEEGDSFLFFDQPADETVQKLLHNQTGVVLVDQFQMTYEQWQGGPVAPVQAGRLRVVSPWHADARAGRTANGQTPIVLDPGVVFGSGTHPTTNHCLTALQMLFDAQPVERVLDLGTGTGLLALAAARLGASQVVAVDLNRLAVETAQRNVELNRMADRILVVQGNAKNFIDLACDVMVSNIHYAVMRPLVESPGFRAHPHFILSGLLRSQAREIEYLLRQDAVKILRKWEKDGIWFTYWGQNV